MPGKHKTPLLGWHPPAELLAWVAAEVARRGGGRGEQSALLTEALTDLRAKLDTQRQTAGSAPEG